MSFSQHHSVLSCVLGTALLAATATAQTAPAPSSAAAHTHAPVTLDQFLISAAPFQRNQIDLAQTTTVLSGRSLLLKQQATLGDTLATETGINATAFGPGSSRPLIRGLGGDRIRLLENGVAMLDASTVSPDHAVSVEPFLIERIEAVRGPASLLYGSTAVGGVVNVISHRIETELRDERVRGEADLRYDSASRGFVRGGVIDAALLATKEHALVLHLDGFRRSARDVRIPDYADSARRRAEEAEEAEEHGEEPPVPARGRLPNSALDSEGGAAGLSFVGRTFHVGVTRTQFDSNYGIPGHAHEHDFSHQHPGEEEHDHAGEEGEAGVRVQLRQRRTDAQGEWRGAPGALLTSLRFRFGRADYRHEEREPDGTVATVFTNRGHDGRAELLHGGAPGLNGALGLQTNRSRFEAEGEEAFLPSSVTRGLAVFAFEEVVRGPITWQFGARLDETRLAAAGRSARRDREFSGSAGAVWKLDDAWSVAVSVSRTGRAPNVQELHADGPHAGTQAYEIGRAGLEAEESLGLEASLRRRAGAVTGALTVFTNRFDGYIFEQASGEVAVPHGDHWDLLDAGDPHADLHDGGLPVYRYSQTDARFWGAELEALWHLHEAPGRQFDVRFMADLTRAREGGRNLPRIPAARAGVGLLWAVEAWSAGADYQRTFAQRRTALGETASDGYGRLSAHVSRAFTHGRVRTEVFLRGTNLTDTEARPHASFLKDHAPLPARSLTAGVRLEF